MKALKNYPERLFEKYSKDVEEITPYSRMTSLHVRVRGEYGDKQEDGLVRTRRYEHALGNGPETLFIDLGYVKSAQVVIDKCNSVYNLYIKEKKQEIWETTL